MLKLTVKLDGKEGKTKEEEKRGKKEKRSEKGSSMVCGLCWFWCAAVVFLSVKNRKEEENGKQKRDSVADDCGCGLAVGLIGKKVKKMGFGVVGFGLLLGGDEGWMPREMVMEEVVDGGWSLVCWLMDTTKEEDEDYSGDELDGGSGCERWNWLCCQFWRMVVKEGRSAMLPIARRRKEESS